MTSRKHLSGVAGVMIATGCLGAAPSAADEFRITMRRHEAVAAIADAKVKEVLAAASRILEESSGDDDLECPVTLVLREPVGTLSAAELPFFISSEADFRKVRSLPGTVKIVGDIGWCGSLGAGIAGCANKPGPALVMTWKSNKMRNAVVLAHEYSHTTGNPHRGDPRTLMGPTASSDNDRVNAFECDNIQGGPSAVQEGDPVAIQESYPEIHGGSRGRGASAVVVAQNAAAGGAGEPAAAEEAPSDVLAFVSMAYAHGVPYADASAFTSDDVPVLEQVIEQKGSDAAAEPDFEVVGNAVATLGAIGTDEATAALRDYLLSDADAEMSADETVAKAGALVSLGWAVNKTGDNASLEMLIDGSNADWWTNVAKVDWKTPAFASREELIKYLVAKSIIGLTLSGAQEARLRLEQIKSGITPGAAQAVLSADQSMGLRGRFGADAVNKVLVVSPKTVEAVQTQGGDEYIAGVLGELEAVQSQGLRDYYE